MEVMELSQEPKYAVKIAVLTLRDRCRILQQRVDMLEQQNLKLQMSSIPNTSEDSLGEICKLNQRIIELTEQNHQLETKNNMVVKENDDLWKRLTKLSRTNKNLGSQLNKINETLTQHASPSPALIRSKTFTQVQPYSKQAQKNIEENDRISLELEDISLKLSDNISKQKQELDELDAEIADTKIEDNFVLNGNFGFKYEDELDEDLVDEVENISKDFKELTNEVLLQKEMLERQLILIQQLRDKKPPAKAETQDQSTSTRADDSELKEKTTADAETSIAEFKMGPSDNFSTSDKICPVCCKSFSKNVEFLEFLLHVETHFIESI